MASLPTKLSELLAFVNSKKEALSEAPNTEELAEFSNGCSDNFISTYGPNSIIHCTPVLMRSLTHLSPITDMPIALAAVTDYEKKHLILSSHEFSNFCVGRSSNNATLNLDPLMNLVFSSSRYSTDSTVLTGYSQNVPADLRAGVVAATIKICCIVSHLFGVFLSFESPTVQNVVSVMHDYARGRHPVSRSVQASRDFSLSGALIGWNTAMIAVEDVFTDRAQVMADSPFDLERMNSLVQSICRSAMSLTASTFAKAVRDWVWTQAVTFDVMDNRFDQAFQRLIEEVAPQDEDDVQLRFSLQQDTRNVRHQRSSSNARYEGSTSADGRSYAARSLNVPDSILGMLNMLPPETRRRLNIAEPPPPTQPAGQPDHPPPDRQAALERQRLVAEEAEKMRRNAQRRHDNRYRNRRLSPALIWRNHAHDIRALRNMISPIGGIRYDLDNPDSENDEIVHERDIADAAIGSGNVDESVEVEILSTLVLYMHIDNMSQGMHRSDESFWKDYGRIKEWYLNTYLDVNRPLFLFEATRALNSEQYADHMKAIIHMETHYQVQRALFARFPRMVNNRTPKVISDALLGKDSMQQYFMVRINCIGHSKMMSNLVCTPYSPSHNVRRSLIKEFPGHTVAVGVVFRQGNIRVSSRLSLFIIRSISHDVSKVDTLDAERDPLLDNVNIRISAPRLHYDVWNLAEGDVIHLIPFCNIVTNLRELKSAHAATTLPRTMQSILFGTSFRDVRHLPNVEPPESREELLTRYEPLQAIRQRVDPGCLRYIDALPPGKCDDSQKRALLTSLGEMGELKEYSSSISLILGPPGCGKSWTIALLCMSLLHHSKAGHCNANAEYPTVLPRPPKELRCSNNPNGLRILITCPSNFGVDEVARKLREALPMPDGTTRSPYIVRIGRMNYDYNDLQDISLHQLAVRYDDQVYKGEPQEGEPPRRYASNEALTALVNEACIFVCTNATAAGPMLAKLGVTVSTVIVDEAAHASEQQTLMSIIANVRLSQLGRVHAVLVGDMMQLGPVFMCSHAAIKFVDRNRLFKFKPKMLRQFESLFDRLHRTNRCRVSWLTSHYRSHPHLAANVLSFMYHDIIQHPLPSNLFEAPYNDVEGPQGLQLLTIIDTRLSKRRFEGRGDGRSGSVMTNDLEVEVVNEVLYRIYAHCGDCNLDNDIIVSSPYLAQVELLKSELARSPNFCSRSTRSPQWGVSIDTVDALQGSERNVAVISLTRSNFEKDIGFLRDDRRLNVAFTRAKKLLVIVGDFSTMNCSQIASYMYWSAVQHYPRTSIQLYQPPTRQVDESQLGMADNIMQVEH